MSKLKVVHISNSVYGGAGRAAYRIHEALLKNGVDSSFVSIDVESSCQLPNVYKETPRSFDQHAPNFYERQKNRIKFRLKKHLGIRIKTAKETITDLYSEVSEQLQCEIATLPFSPFNILKNPIVQNADIIHLHWVANMIDYPSFFNENKKPVVWTLHDMNPLQGLFHYEEDNYRNKTVSHHVDKKVRSLKRNTIRKRKANLAVVCPSNWLLKNVVKSKALKKTKYYYIPNSLDTDMFSSSIENDLKNSLNIPDENTVFMFVSQNVSNHRKGFDLLIKALENIIHHRETLLVIGNTDQFKIPGLDVRMLGTISDDRLLSKYYSLADAFIIPSREDNLPNIMLESMACGTPVLSFNVGGMAEIIIDGFNGLKASKTEPRALANIINEFIKTKNNFKAEAIRDFALEHFSNNIIAEKYKEVYQSLLQ